MRLRRALKRSLSTVNRQVVAGENGQGRFTARVGRSAVALSVPGKGEGSGRGEIPRPCDIVVSHRVGRMPARVASDDGLQAILSNNDH